VKVQRNGTLCKVVGRITPEHRIRIKPYIVTAEIDESEENIVSVVCDDCPASEGNIKQNVVTLKNNFIDLIFVLGGCKHVVAFVFWLHRRSEEPSPTEIKCYWAKARLSKAANSDVHLAAEDTGKKRLKLISTIEQDSLNAFFTESMNVGLRAESFSPIIKHYQPKPDLIGIDGLMQDYSALNQAHDAAGFIAFAKGRINPVECISIARNTVLQSKSKVWEKMRYGRVTASKFWEVAHCNTVDGMLVEGMLGGLSFKPTVFTKRGLNLEKQVFAKLKTSYPEIQEIGVIINNAYPIYAASPDGINKDFIFEIKCPAKTSTVKNYLKDDGSIANKFKAQMNLQMLLSGRKKGIFCVADVKFEENNETTEVEIDLDEKFCAALMLRSGKFWKNCIFPKLF
jgi:hypothetical protein